MRFPLLIPAFLLAASMPLAAQESPAQHEAVQDIAAKDAPPPKPNHDFRYSFAAIDDATLYSNLRPPLPASLSQVLNDPSFTLLQNQLLLEPFFTLRYRSRWSIASSVVALFETFRGLSAADFDVPPGNVVAPDGL
ncbi:MAG TPA: hypothetical protein VGE83_03910, partial [Terracidiphilus sp.]